MSNDDSTRILETAPPDVTRVTVRPLAPAGRLLILNGARRGTEVPISRFPFTIGRSQRNDLVIADETVSAFHARLVLEGHQTLVEDLGSRNGTSVNEQPTSRRAVTGGETITFGGARVRYLAHGTAYDLGTADEREQTKTMPGTRPWRRWLAMAFLAIAATGLAAVGRHLKSKSGEEPSANRGSESRAVEPPAMVLYGSASRAAVDPVSGAVTEPSPQQAASSVVTNPIKARIEVKVLRMESGAVSAQQDRAAFGDSWSQVRRSLVRGDWRSVEAGLGACSDCTAEAVAAARIIAAEARDLPGVVAALGSIDTLSAYGVDGRSLRRVIIARYEATVDHWLVELIEQGLGARARAALERLSSLGMKMEDGTARQQLRSQAQAVYERGYALERVNPEEAKRLYAQALELLPMDEPLRERISRRVP